MYYGYSYQNPPTPDMYALVYILITNILITEQSDHCCRTDSTRGGWLDWLALQYAETI